MKQIIYRFIFTVILCSTVFVSSASSHSEIEEAMLKQPRTVMKDARKALAVAQKNGNSPQLIDALMQISAAQLLIDSDSIVAVTDEIKQTMQQSNNPVERSVIAIYLCDLYRYWCNKDYQSHYNVYIPNNANIATWNTRNYDEAIDSLITIALSATNELQKTPIKNYRNIIEVDGYDGRDAWKLVAKFYPTMYDFVIEQLLSYVDDPIQYIDDVVQFHSCTGAAHFNWSLKKILTLNGVVENKNSELISNMLDSLIEQYDKHDYVIEAVVERAMIAVGKAETAHLRRAVYNDMQSWIKRYPRYYRIGCLKQMCAELSYVHINAATPLVNYPDDSIVVNLEYCNTADVDYMLYRCNGVGSRVEGVGQPSSTGIMRDFSRFDEWQDVTLVCDSNLRLSDSDALSFQERNATFSLPQLPCGVYILKIKSGKEIITQPFAVATHLLYGIEATNREIVAVVVDNRLGHPIEGVEVCLLTSQGDTVQRAKTDTDGICRFDNRNQSGSYWLKLKNNDLYPFAVRTNFNEDMHHNESASIRLFTDRSIYRPGQELHFSAIMYHFDSIERALLSGKELNLVLRDAAYNELWRDTLTTDEYGSIHGTLTLPEKALAGNWQIAVECGNSKCNRYITVAEYKRPQFSIAYNPVEGAYSYGDTVEISGEAMSYSSVPISYAEVRYTVKQSSWYGYKSEIIQTDTIQTDANGMFSFDFIAVEPAESLRRKWGTRYQIDVAVTSSTCETQSNMMFLSISGTSVRFNLNIPSIVCREEAKPFDIIIVNGENIPQQLPMQVSLYSLTSNSIGTSLGNMDVNDTPIWTHGYAHNQSIVELPMSSLPSGAYRLKVSTQDLCGEMVEDSTDFILYSHHDTNPPVPTALWVPINQITIKQGSSAHIQVGTSFIDASLLCIVKECNEIKDMYRIALSNSVATIEVPYLSSYTDAVKVEFLLVRDKTIYDKQVVVYPSQPDLSLIISPQTFRDKTQPGMTEKWQFAVRDTEGKPVDALFMAEMYDASLNALSAHSWYFNPQYRPQIPYIGLAQYWNYNRTQNDYLGYFTEYNDAHAYSALSPVLYTYFDDVPFGFGIMYRTPRMMRSETQRKTNSISADFSAEVSYDSAVVDEAVVSNVAEADLNANSVEENKFQVEYRTDMRETAFFYPHLVTDEKGNVHIEFTVPQSNTTWNFMSLAVTPSLQHALYNATVISKKPLMVSPNIPRFVRQGDKSVLAVAIQNTTEQFMRCDAQLSLYNPENEVVIHTLKQTVAIEANEVKTIYFDVEIPRNLSLLGVRVGAATAQYSDGEQHIVAVLPATQLVTESQPFYIAPNVADTTITFTSMQQNILRPTVENYSVSLEYCDNPAWYAVTAMPMLSQPTEESATAWMASLYANAVARGIIRQNPTIAAVIGKWSEECNTDFLTSQLMKNNDLKQIVLSQTPWLLDAQNTTQQLQQIASLLNSEKATEMSRIAVLELFKLQGVDGGWSWFKNMPSSYWLTLNILNGLSRLELWGETDNDEQIARMVIEALKYVDTEYVKMNNNHVAGVTYLDLCYLYVRSVYTDHPMNDDVLLIMHKQLDNLSKEWYRLDEIEKAYAAMALYRMGDKAVAVEIINSLREYATITPQQGMFWANNRSTAYYRNSAIQVHCAIYEAIDLVDNNREELDMMRQWLLLQKQTQSWGTVPSTLDAANILLNSGSNWLGTGMNSRIEWGGEPLPQASQAESVLGYGKWTRDDNAINQNDANVTICEHNNQPSWGAIYWQYFDEISQVTEQGSNEISLHRSYYVQRQGKWVSVDTAGIRVGDEVLVRLEFYTDRDMQFMVLNDPRPACFEPLQQLPQYASTTDIGYYNVPSDAANTFYIDHLPRGTHQIQYRVYADRSGAYQAGVAALQSYYAPQYTAHSAGKFVNVVMQK